MNFVRFLLALLVVAGIGLLALGAYQAGVAAGVAAEATGTVAVPYYGWGWGPGFGFFGFLGFLFFLFLLFGLIRAATWGGRGRGWGGPGRWNGPDGRRNAWEGRGRELFDDWHRRAHEGEPGQAAPDRPIGQA